MERYRLTLKESKERPSLEEQITVINNLRQISQLAATVGHEVRNPLATVRGLLQILLSKTMVDKEKEYYELMIGELDRANNLLGEFLTLAKAKSFRASWVNLNQVIESIYPLILADAVNAGKTLEADLGDVPDLFLDRSEIIQLILNLVRNALEATPKGKRVIIKTEALGEEVIFSVQDEGSGISQEIIREIGTPFYSTKEEGTGLGLAVCQNIANDHNAAIEIETSDQGSIFWVYFKRKSENVV